MSEQPNSPSWWADAQAHLRHADAVMRGIVDTYHGEMMASRGDAFFTLARAIAGQQISVKAAESVWKKLAAALGEVTPAAMLALNEEQLRACGLSRSKVLYMRSLAGHFTENPRPDWDTMSDDEIIKELVSIKGIGRWTAEMFLIFHLLRPDVLPLDDIGLRKAVERHYHAGVKMKPAEIRELAGKWQPWRSAATWYLWRSLDPVPVEY